MKNETPLPNFGQNAAELDSASAKRHVTNEPAIVEVYGRTGKIFCRMNNLSTSGAFFEITNSYHTPRQGDVVRVTVNLKQLGKTHTLHGQIIWCRGLGLGVAFIKNKDLYKKIAK
ncbi:MAG: PilZ domain-containing protein [Bdellovibrionaceae bacterium]|nr:PilZ domain-containing protein [Pseudobdellovibrionaceae bacterium]